MQFAYSIIYVADVPATLAFWQQAFGLQQRMLAPTGDYGELHTGATTLAFAREDTVPTAGSFSFNRPGQPAAGAEIGLTTNDVSAAYATAVAAGATPVLAPTAKPWGQTVAYVRDNNGFLVELCSPMA